MNRYLASSLLLFSVVFCTLPLGLVSAGPYTEAGIPSNDPRIVAWASGWTNVIRGPKDIANPGGGNASAGSPNNVLGPVTCDVGNTLSLGDGGQLTLTFDAPIYDGAGEDLVIFENGFFSGLGVFAELGFVEVSTDGVHFARFPGVSLTSGPVGSYDTIEPTDIYYLAGKHPGANQQPCEGTGFDLSSLSNHPDVLSGDVDLSEINYVKVIDVIGNGSTQDSLGNPIYDPYPTDFENGGCDLQAVGVIHSQGSCTDGDEDDYAVEGGGCGPVDCDDTDPDIHPGAGEGPPGDPSCSDGVDNDCDGAKDTADSGCYYNPGSCAGGTTAEAAGTGTDSQQEPEGTDPFLLFLLPLYAIGVWWIRKILVRNT
jgi:hypothetical protein